MNKRFSFTLLALLFCSTAALAQDALPTPRFVPPEIRGNDAQAFYKDMAIIETNCSDWTEVRALWKQLTEKGALISVIASPKRWIGWVPTESKDAVGSARLNSATGSLGVTSISYTAGEFRTKHSGMQLQSTSEEESALVEYLEHAKHTRTPEELQRIEERTRELDLIAPTVQQPPCVFTNPEPIPLPETASSPKGPSTQGGANPSITRRSTPQGLIVHTSVFPESQSGTGSWNWDMTVYNRYRNLHLDAMHYWTAQASKYGKSATLIWRLYGPTHWCSQVSGEPTVIGEHTFIPVILNNIYPPDVWDILFGRIPNWNGSNGLDRGDAWGWYYNNKIRDYFGADQAICAFIAWKGTPNEGIWPHARSVTWGNGDHEGIYYAMDVRYWQAGLDPYAMPSRNVCAHEIGHLWGSPDEYRTDNCTWSYRGAENINCQTTRPTAPGRPGYKIVGFDAMMVGNYLSGSSSVMPVHMGLLTAGQRTPLRCFTSQPANIPITLHICDNSSHALSTRTLTGPTCVPMEWDFCYKTEVPLTRSISGSTWYFDHFEVKRENGATTNIDDYANNMPSYAFTSTQANPVTDVKAVYTNTPPDFNTANTTVTAWLAPAGNSATPNPAVALRWRNKYDMQKVVTKIEWERSAGTWVEVQPVLGPFPVSIGQYTGVIITALPLAGGGTTAVAANTQYRFRIVGIFNTIRGTNSVVAEIRTRPSSPTDTVYCRDAQEPNSAASPKVLTSSGPGMAPYLFKAACPISMITGEFTWFKPKYDYYRVTAINLSNVTGGERLTLVLHVSDGSKFKPVFRAKMAGSSTYINSSSGGPGYYILSLSVDGTYDISVEPEISSFISYRLIEPSTGDFGFGEYTISVDRTYNKPPLVAFCPTCVKVSILQPISGLLISKAPGDLFDKGVDKNTPGLFDVLFHPPAGFIFDGWDLPKPEILEDPKANPTKFKYGPNTPPGEYELGAKLRPVAQGQNELVVIFPQGPDGPFEARTLHSTGAVVNVTAPANPNYLFLGWSHDTAATTNPLPVTMWRSKKLIATWREKPCQPEPMVKWVHRATLTNAKNGSVTIDYGMDPSAGDGLEAGQVDLPPIPPPGPFDIRFINIPGSQGSITDLRAIQQSFSYSLRVQTGTTGTAPVQMTWGAPPVSPNATFFLYVQGEPAPFNMRTTSSYTFAAEGTYNCRIEVKMPECPPKSKEPEVVIVPTRNDPTRFPCVELAMQFRDRKTDMLYPLYNPYQFHLFEKNDAGEWGPIRITEIVQLPTMTLFRICTEEGNPKPNREIVIVNDDQDPDTKKDTITVNIPVPNPTGTGTPVRMVQQHSGDWELVSIPLDVKYPESNVIFSDPMTRLFGFDPTTGSYVPAPIMEFGDGYWLKTEDKATVYYGMEKLIWNWDTLNGIGQPFGFGWNLIGAVSKPLAVAAIQQTPAGGLKSIFGYDPALGYVVPTICNPGQGFWVRVDPNTKLKMQAPGVAGQPTVTAYAKTAAGLNIVANLVFTTGRNERQELPVTTTRISAADADILLLPPLPYGSGLDVRTEAGTRYIPFGVTGIDIRSQIDVKVTFEPVVATQDRYQLLDENDAVLAEFNGAQPVTVTIPASNAHRIFLKTMTSGISGSFALDQNWPNPFSPMQHEATTIAVTFGTPSHARLAVYDVMGRQVRLLLDQDLPAGMKHLRWDGRDSRGALLPAGTYLLRLQAAEGTITKSMTITHAK